MLNYANRGFSPRTFFKIQGLSGDFTRGLRPLLEDWAEVACSQKTWKLNH